MTAATLVNQLEKFRRRESIVSATGIAMHAALAATAAALLAARIADPAIATIACAILAAVVTVVVTMLRRPSLATIAAALDHHARLSDRVVTALEHRNGADPVAQLLLRDAATRAAEISPAALFPFRVPPRIAWTASAAALAIVAATLVPEPNPAAPPASHSAGEDGATDVPQPGTPSAPAGTTPGNRTQTPKQRRAETPRESGAAPGATRQAAMIPPVTNVAGRDGRLGARAAGGTATGRTDSGGALVAQPANRQPGVAAAAADAGAPRRVALSSSAAAPGQRQVPPGLRAYVRRYFEAISK